MNNPILKIFQNLSDDELRKGILEMQEDGEEGIIRNDGVVRKCANKCGEITGNPVSTDLFLATTNLYKEAAERWANNDGSSYKIGKFNVILEEDESLKIVINTNKDHLQLKPETNNSVTLIAVK